MTERKRGLKIRAGFLAGTILLSGCNGAKPVEGASPTPSRPDTSPTATWSPTITPSPSGGAEITPTPETPSPSPTETVGENTFPTIPGAIREMNYSAAELRSILSTLPPLG